ncbi:hypothetical protein JW935_17240, partial [candidate division KSB1 bacterium]|nr:hypothetical protein [candidate division KSB1 bacterium]
FYLATVKRAVLDVDIVQACASKFLASQPPLDFSRSGDGGKERLPSQYLAFAESLLQRHFEWRRCNFVKGEDTQLLHWDFYKEHQQKYTHGGLFAVQGVPRVATVFVDFQEVEAESRVSGLFQERVIRTQNKSLQENDKNLTAHPETARMLDCLNQASFSITGMKIGFYKRAPWQAWHTIPFAMCFHLTPNPGVFDHTAIEFLKKAIQTHSAAVYIPTNHLVLWPDRVGIAHGRRDDRSDAERASSPPRRIQAYDLRMLQI